MIPELYLWGCNVSQRAHQLIIQYRMVSPKNKHTNTIIWTKQIVFICMQQQLTKKGGNEFEREQRGLM